MLEIRGVSKSFAGVRALHDVSFEVVRRRGPCARRGERGRQEHADEDPQRRPHRLHAARCSSTAQPLVAAQPARRPAPRDRHHLPRAQPDPRAHRRREHLPRPRDAQRRRAARHGRHGPGGAGAARPPRPADLDEATGQDAAGRRAATRRGRQGAVARRPAADPRRADVGAQRGGDPPPLRRDRRPQGRRRHLDLHLPQVRRGVRDRRPGHRAARRGVHRHRLRRRDESARADPDDGRTPFSDLFPRTDAPIGDEVCASRTRPWRRASRPAPAPSGPSRSRCIAARSSASPG